MRSRVLQSCDPCKKTDQKLEQGAVLCFSELSVSGGICGGDQLVSISERLIAIMKNYVSAERYFPVGKLEGRKRSTAELHVQQFVCSE